MDTMAQYMISNQDKMIQVPYAEYVILMKKMEEAQRILQVKAKVLADLQCYLAKRSDRPRAAAAAPQTAEEEGARASVPAAEPSRPTIALEIAPEAPAGRLSVEVSKPAPKTSVVIPPVKKEIEAHFNAHDDSGRLLNVFKQYYTCLNELCGGTVRVTMKDGICSLWNYDEWEEFAFIDIYENELRFAVDPRYTDALSVLDFCEVPRLLATRRKLICIQVEDLSKTMLGVLSKAFEEVGLALG